MCQHDKWYGVTSEELTVWKVVSKDYKSPVRTRAIQYWLNKNNHFVFSKTTGKIFKYEIGKLMHDYDQGLYVYLNKNKANHSCIKGKRILKCIVPKGTLIAKAVDTACVGSLLPIEEMSKI